MTLSRRRRSLKNWLAGLRAEAIGGSIVPLALGASVVVTLSGMSQTSYHDVPTIMQMRSKDPAFLKGSSTQKLAVVALTLEQRQMRLVTVYTDDGLASMQQRMAMNILLRSGYLAEAQVTKDEREPQSRPSYAVRVDDEISSCAQRGEAQGAQRDLSNLAVAIVAAEKFNRSPLQRRMEWLWAGTAEVMTGTMPDLSLGPAQIRFSTVRRLAANEEVKALLQGRTDDAALRSLVSDECSAVKLTSAIISATAQALGASKRCQDEDSCINLAILRYNGHRHESQAVVDYLGLVRSMAQLLAQGLPDTPPPPDVPEECEKGVNCAKPQPSGTVASGAKG